MSSSETSPDTSSAQQESLPVSTPYDNFMEWMFDGRVLPEYRKIFTPKVLRALIENDAPKHLAHTWAVLYLDGIPIESIAAGEKINKKNPGNVDLAMRRLAYNLGYNYLNRS